MKKRRSVNHFGMTCPVPGCGHIGGIITKAHCEIAHGMKKEEVYKIYGEPTEVVYDPYARRMNMSLYKGEYEDEFTEII